jgi:tRNA(adenine34) deaminase
MLLVTDHYAGLSRSMKQEGTTDIVRSLEEPFDSVDRTIMERCLALAMQAADHGEYPYAAIVCRAGKILCEATSSVRQNHDATQHAELTAIKKAYRALNRTGLEDCTIYSNTEPCALCSYAIRESRIGRVVYGIPAPLTGGMSRWNIFADQELSNRLPEVFAPPPEIVAGFMREQIEAAIAARHPLAWEFIRARKMYGGPLPLTRLSRNESDKKNGFAIGL